MKEYKTVMTAKSAKAFRKHDDEVNRLILDGWEVVDTQVRLTQSITKLQREHDPNRPKPLSLRQQKVKENLERNKQQWATIKRPVQSILGSFKRKRPQ